MRALSVAFAVLAVTLTGCSNSVNNAVAHIEPKWKLELAAMNGMTTGCPSGFDTVALYSQPLDSSNNPVGKPSVDEFECAAGNGISPALPPGTYDERVVLENHAATMTAAASPDTLELNGQPLTLASNDAPISEIVVLDGGFFRFEPALVGATSGSAVMCANALAATIQLTATNVSSPSSVFTSTGACNSDTGFGVQAVLSDPIPAGVYSVDIVANSAAGSAVGPVTTLDNQMIQAASALQPVTDLKQVTVQVNGM